jgi:ribosomal protein L32E
MYTTSRLLPGPGRMLYHFKYPPKQKAERRCNPEWSNPNGSSSKSRQQVEGIQKRAEIKPWSAPTACLDAMTNAMTVKTVYIIVQRSVSGS